MAVTLPAPVLLTSLSKSEAAVVRTIEIVSLLASQSSGSLDSKCALRCGSGKYVSAPGVALLMSGRHRR